MIQDSIPTEFYRSLVDPQFGLAQAETHAIITYLDQTYGRVTREERNKNVANMEKPYDPSTPPETLWNQIEKGVQFANPYDPITMMRRMDMAINNLAKTGKFKTAIEKFEALPTNDRTWTRLKLDINTYWENNQLSMATATDTGYANAAQTGKSTTDIPPEAVLIPGTNNYMLYCHTHGLMHTKGKHTSKDCKTPGPHHNPNAKFGDMKGGNCLIGRTSQEPVAAEFTYQVKYSRKRARRDEDTPTGTANAANTNGRNENSQQQG